MLVSGCFIATLVVCAITLPTTQSIEPTFVLPHRGCYFSSWSIYRPGKAHFLPRHIDPSLCTILYYAFAEIKLDTPSSSGTSNIRTRATQSFGFLTKAGSSPYTNASVSVMDTASQLKFLKRKNPNLKLILSIGGWGTASTITSIASSADLRRLFIPSLIRTIREIGYDGLDISWEWPTKSDAPYFTSLFTEIRAALDAEAQSTRTTRLIFTAAVGNTTMPGYNFPLMFQVLDLINLMTYDLHTPYFEPGETGHHTQLYPPFSNTSSTNVRDFAEKWEEVGAPKSKLVLGLATYGNTWNLTNADKFGIGAPTNGHGPQGFYTRSDGYMAYYELCEKIRSGEIISTVQPDIKTPYARSTVGKWWTSYEDENSLREKVKWAIGKQYSGVFVWDITFDDFFGGCGAKYPLLNAIKSEYRA
ncbi:Acidic mammalian chitinase [Hypsibius exemplaris]|uniref:Acidic mammalian chitinase n=1 Tax=Hypsibius exemplaris TaxID=2072580 RepID=A0A1W0WL15_HYPEX|nr:Acidic mammalian chitinase [Hypsibius exemplaris]